MSAPARVAASEAPLLAIEGLQAWYGESHVLHGISFDVRAGELVSLLGRNGAGKTTTLRSIMGLVSPRTGSIRFDGRELIRQRPATIGRLGIGYCPEERGIFASLDVEENLMLPPRIRDGGMSVPELFEMFPNLRDRLRSTGTALSGGEQQMLAIARILRTGARFLLLDEPTEGLAPVIVKQIGATIRKLKERGFTIVLVVQSLPFAAQVADRHVVVERGVVVDRIAAGEMESAGERLNRYLSV
jgi:branched-chain amino acid transport system ATP-binding protein